MFECIYLTYANSQGFVAPSLLMSIIIIIIIAREERVSSHKKGAE